MTALAAAKTLVVPEAANQRLLVTNRTHDIQELTDILYASSVIGKDAKKRIPVAKPGQRLAGTHYKVNNQKARDVLKL